MIFALYIISHKNQDFISPLTQREALHTNQNEEYVVKYVTMSQTKVVLTKLSCFSLLWLGM